MDSIINTITKKSLLVSLISALFIIYPNIICLPYELEFIENKTHYIIYSMFFVFRFLYIWMLFYLMIHYNLKKGLNFSLKTRFCHNFVITAMAYVFYLIVYYLAKQYGVHDCIGSFLIFQFFVVCAYTSLLGHIVLLTINQKEKEREIERLRMENLQSKCDALSNQINPHFFFNSLSGIASLIRKKNDDNTLNYLDKLSDIFRYILQSNHNGIVPLREELDFINSFKYVMEVRFANKLSFVIDINEDSKDAFSLPVLSLLPIIDNIITHNIIDSNHKMTIYIVLNDKNELVITNQIYNKPTPPVTNGTGLKNLESRFLLMVNKTIRVENDSKNFIVYLPLK